MSESVERHQKGPQQKLLTQGLLFLTTIRERMIPNKQNNNNSNDKDFRAIKRRVLAILGHIDLRF